MRFLLIFGKVFFKRLWKRIFELFLKIFKKDPKFEEILNKFLDNFLKCFRKIFEETLSNFVRVLKKFLFHLDFVEEYFFIKFQYVYFYFTTHLQSIPSSNKNSATRSIHKKL